MTIENPQLKTLAWEGEKIKSTVDSLTKTLLEKKKLDHVGFLSSRKEIESFIDFCLEKIQPVATDLYTKIDRSLEQFNGLKKSIPPEGKKELTEVSEKFITPIKEAKSAFSDISSYWSNEQKNAVVGDIAKLDNYSKAFKIV